MRVARVLIGLKENLDLMNLPGEGREETPSSGRRSRGVGGGASDPLGAGLPVEEVHRNRVQKCLAVV